MSELKLILKARPLWALVLFGILVAVVAFLIGVLTPTGPGFRGPLVDINDGIMLGVLTAMILFLGNLYNRQARLEERINVLETTKAEALADLSAAASFINRIGLAWRQWIATGVAPAELPQPPEQLGKHGVDSELWTDPVVGGTDPD